MFAWLRRRRRRKLAAQPTPESWLKLLDERVPFYASLEPDDREHFIALLKGFVAEKRFAGAKGMEITDEHRVLISASAVRLILQLDLDYYNHLYEIVVFPTAAIKSDQHDGLALGLAHSSGVVHLSWPAVLRGLKRPDDGRDTTLHEFAHILDLSDGVFDGTPLLRHVGDVRLWIGVMTEHYERLVKRGRRKSLLRDYGGTNPAEFFAVASEVFFEQPETLKKQKPELYEELRRFYGYDPVAGERRSPADRMRARRNARKRKSRRGR